MITHAPQICFDETVPKFCHMFYNGWTISTPNFSPKATSNHELLQGLIYEFFHCFVSSQTPLHLASSKGYSKCIQILLDYGANMNIKNTHRETAFNLVKGKVKCERVFLHAIAKYQIPQRSAEQQKRVESKGGKGEGLAIARGG